MTEEEHILTVLQFGDSFFPSGAVSFSWGIEMLKEDNIIMSKKGVNDFLENQLIHKWATFERVVIAHTYLSADKINDVVAIDKLVESMTVTSELRDGSKRLGSALLATHTKLNTPGAEEYQRLIQENSAHGHLPVIHGLISKSIGQSKNSALIISAYNFCVAILGAAIRLGIIGHIDCQKSLNKFRPLISELTTQDIPSLENIYAFTPYADIASMRHENTNTRLFAN
ncbi:MAG: urease accessory UreF family protein [Gammaproteobacteria bacterium]|nr:urease accessory UreF family protein [Gammaproteobacteria bacterium]